MASFETDLQAPQGAGASVVAPVDTGKNIPRIFGDVIEGLGKFGEQRAKERAEELKNSVVGQFAKEYTKIEDGLISGELKPDRANVLRRSVFSKYVANYSEYTKEFNSIQGALFEGGAVKGALEEEKSGLEMKRQLKKDAISSGFLFPENMSSEFEDSQLRAFQASRLADANFKRMADKVHLQTSMNQEQRTNSQFVQRQNVLSTLKTLAQEHFEPASLFARDMATKAAKGEDPAILMQQANQYFANLEAGITAASASDPELGNSFRNMFNSLRKNTEEGISGKTRTEAMENQIKEIQNQLMLTAMGNPRLQALWAQSKIFGGPIIINEAETQEAFGKILQLADTTGKFQAPPDLFSPGSQVFEMLMGRNKALINGQMTDREGATTELSTIANNVNKALGGLDVSQTNANQLQSAAAYYASPEYASLISKGQVDKVTASKAKDVLNLVYERTITRGVEQKLNSTFQFTANKEAVPVADIINIQFNGAGVDFGIKQVGYLSPVDRQDQQQFVRELKASKDAVNQMIHIGAHMEGHTDYSGYWERNKHIIMPSYYPDPSRLKVGQVEEGYEYVGGPPASKNSWKKVEVAND